MESDSHMCQEEAPSTSSHSSIFDFSSSAIGQTSMLLYSQPSGSTTDKATADDGIPKTNTVPDLPSLCFPMIHPTSLHPIDLSQPLPVSHIGADPSHTSSTDDFANHAQTWSQLRRNYGSYSRHRLRMARKEIFYKLGLRSHWCDERKLIAAVVSSEASRVLQLLEEGANPNVCDQKKRTPLHIAASQGQDYVASLLLAKRADPNRQDILGNTPLHLAVCRGDRATIKLLIDNGADIFVSDNNGRTPVSLVTSRLATLRRQQFLTADRLKSEFMLISDFLQHHTKRRASSTSMDDLCHMMQTVSTKEEVDEIAEAVFNKMSDMSIANNHTPKYPVNGPSPKCPVDGSLPKCPVHGPPPKCSVHGSPFHSIL